MFSLIDLLTIAYWMVPCALAGLILFGFVGKN